MRVFIIAALFLHVALGAEPTYITIKSCGGGRPMIKCKGTLNGVMANVRFWAKYPNYAYKTMGDVGSQWICETALDDQFLGVVPKKFTLESSGLTLLVRGGNIIAEVKGANKNCPLDF